MAPPRPRSKRSAAVLDDYGEAAGSRKKVGFKVDPTFYDDNDIDSGEEEANGIQVLKRMKVAPTPWENTGFGPHIIKMGQHDADMLDRVVHKYKKMGHSVQLKNSIIKLNVIKAAHCLQEEVMEAFTENLAHTDMILVSASGQEIPCHRFVLSVRSPVFKRLLSSQRHTLEPLREGVDADTVALKAMVKYLYTDSLDNADINEDLMTLADKYELTQMKELCLPYFVKKISVENCLKAYIYGHLHNYEPLKFVAFNTLDENWKRYENSTDLVQMMQSHPNAVMEIINRLYKKKAGYLVRSPQINLKMIKAFECLQEEIIKAFNEKLDHTDMALVSKTGQEIPCHKFILATRSQDFKAMLAAQPASEEPLRIPLEVTTASIKALVKYLYTDSVDNDDITEDLIALSEKYNLTQLKEYCMPTMVENINSGNCIQMYIYGYKHNFEELKTAAFRTLDENWKNYAKSSDFLEMMKSCPNAVLEIMSRLQKTNVCQPIVLEDVKPQLVDF